MIHQVLVYYVFDDLKANGIIMRVLRESCTLFSLSVVFSIGFYSERFFFKEAISLGKLLHFILHGDVLG